MKKFMRNCAITAFTMFLAGIITITTVMIVKGPEIVAALTQCSYEILDRLNLGVYSNLIPDLDFNSDIPMLKADVQQTIDSAEITKLDIDLGASTLKILPSEDQYFYASVDSSGTCQAYSDAELLCVKATTGDVTLYIPKDYSFDQVSITVGAGEISGASAFRAAELIVELAAGEINLSNVEAEHLDTAVGAGSLTFAGNILQSVDARCSMGDLTLWLTGTETDFNYDAEVTAGEITIDEKSLGGISQKCQINNDASKNAKVKCSLGNIDISFAGN